MIDELFEVLADRFGPMKLPRRWDGKNLSSTGRLTTSFRVVAGAQPGVGTRWAGYATSVSENHLWIGRSSMYVEHVAEHDARPPNARELLALDPDCLVLPVLARSGARLEWALRASAVGDVMALLKPSPERL